VAGLGCVNADLAKARIYKGCNMFGYKVPALDEAMPIFGARAAGNAPKRSPTRREWVRYCRPL
jgi:hypothetical protein